MDPTRDVGTQQWIAIPVAAAAIDTSTDTIRRMISRGEIEAKRFGPRLIRVNLDSLFASGKPLQYVGSGGA